MFWNDLIRRGKPIVGLSPMDGVTDAAMRYMSAKYGRPDIMFSEFVSVDALHFAPPERRERLLRTFIRAKDVDQALRVDLSKSEQSTLRDQPFKYPYEIAQVFGHTPEYFVEAAELVEKLGFDGIDINMGCPAHKVEELGSGAGLIRTPALAQEIIRTVKSATKLPVSVKTRIGVDRDVAEEWMEALMEVSPAMISLHGRTLRQLYQGSADWEAIGRAAQVVHKYGGKILGNGDISSIADGRKKAKQYCVDGFLIGRAAEGNPWVFTGEEASREQKLEWILEHARIFEKIFAERVDLSMSERSTLRDQPSKWFLPVRKHLAWYAHGFPGAVELRAKLVQCNSSQEVINVISSEVERSVIGRD